MLLRRPRARLLRLCAASRTLSYLSRPSTVFGIGAVCLLASIGLLNMRANLLVVQHNDQDLSLGLTMAQREEDPHTHWKLTHQVSTSQLEATLKRLLDFRTKVKPGRFAVLPSNPKPEASSDIYFRFSDQVASQASRAARIRAVCEWQHHQQLQQQLQQQQNDHRLSQQELLHSGSIQPQQLKGEQLSKEPYHTGWYGKQFVYSFVEAYVEQNVVICPTLKVGSTFWRRFWYAVHHGRQISTPYDIPIHTALNSKRRVLKNIADPSSYGTTVHKHPHPLSTRPTSKLLHRSASSQANIVPEEKQWNVSAVEEFVRNAGTIMFTREPFAKLLSGYVDKLFAPNPYFWGAIGKDIVKRFRPNATKRSLTCGHDVTFPEFIKYVILSERSGYDKRDTHFVPSFDQCQPCNFSYDIVGKMETFPMDASLVLAQLGFNLSQSELASWGQLGEEDAILDSVNSVYQVRNSVVKCLDWKEASRRVWRKLQIRGIVDKNQRLPESTFSRYSKRARDFIGVAKDAMRTFRTSGRKSVQKKEALSSAYSLVSKADLEELREYFLIDFDVFGYDSRPASVFDAKRTWDVFNITH